MFNAPKGKQMTADRGSLQDLDVIACDWIVNVQDIDGEPARVTVKACSEQSACISAEDQFDCIAISAYRKA
jgi:hypothetical protein